MKNIKIELLGMGVILFGIAVSTNNFFSYVGGVIGLVIMIIGCFGIKDK